jgi:hypothetical protein
MLRAFSLMLLVSCFRWSSVRSQLTQVPLNPIIHRLTGKQ